MGNSNSGSKEEIIVKCSLEDMVKHFFKDYAVVWHDPNANNPENQQYIVQLKQFCEVLTFTEWEKALVSIQESKAACHVITSGTDGEVFVEEIYEIPHVTKIYIFCMNKEYHSAWAQKYQKVSCVETNIQNLINQIKQNLLEWYREISSLKLNLPAFAPIFNDDDKSEMNHLHRYLRMISSFKNRAQAKSDLLNLSRIIYTDPNNTKHIADFDKYYTEYNKAQILRWYTRESFLYKVTNNCLRIANADSIQYCRFLLKDLEQAIKDQYQTKSKHFGGLLFRGAYLSQEEWTSLKENQDKEIEMHGFLSVSKEKNVALTFMQTNATQKVLITILVPKGPNEEEQGFAEIEEFSFFPQEREILFNVRSRFTVLETEDEYSPELPYRHLVLLHGAQGLRKFAAEKNPTIKVPISNMLTCCHCTQKSSPPNLLFSPLDKQIYYCKNCIIENASNTTAFLAIPTSKNIPKETIVKGCLLTNNNNNNNQNQNQNQFNSSIPFYGYKCSQCRAKKQKSYFICTDCSQQNKLIWCEDCFTNTISCIEAQHNILLETRPYTFWTQKMSEAELNHLKFHDDFISENSDNIFRQAEMYYQSHKYEKAIEHYNLYLERSPKKILDTQRVSALNSLGDLYMEQRNYGKALECHLKAMEFSKSLFGINRHSVALSYRKIGSSYIMLKDYVKAHEYHLKALDTYNFLEEKDEIATCYGDIGDVLRKQGQYTEALGCYFKSLEISRSQHGENNLSVALSYNNIGFAFREQKEYEKSLKYFFKALKITQSLQGERHSSIATYYNNIGRTYKMQKEYAKAHEYYLKALEIQKLLYGEKHPDIAFAYNNIAAIFSEEKKYDKALEYYLKSLEIKKSTYGENHLSTSLAYTNVAVTLHEQGEYAKALEYLFKVLKIRKLLYKEKSKEVAEDYSIIGGTYMKLSEYTKALEYHLKSLEIKKSLYGENHSEIAASYFNLGRVLNNQGEYNKAEEYILKAVNIRKTLFGENSSVIATSYYVLADIYMNKKEHTKASEYCLKCLEIRDSVLGKDHPDTVQAQNKLLEIKSAHT